MTRTADPPSWWTTDEWTTPPEIVAEYGDFDLDPCAREESAKATYFYTKADDGLAQDWFGRVWVNPPYSNPAPWCQKAVAEIQAGRVTEVVMLLPGSIDTGWFHDWVVPYAEIHFRRGRIRFYGWDARPRGTPTQGSVVAIYRRSLDT
jgi:phage N-6-adenine-methyltransferase